MKRNVFNATGWLLDKLCAIHPLVAVCLFAGCWAVWFFAAYKVVFR